MVGIICVAVDILAIVILGVVFSMVFLEKVTKQFLTYSLITKNDMILTFFSILGSIFAKFLNWVLSSKMTQNADNFCPDFLKKTKLRLVLCTVELVSVI